MSAGKSCRLSESWPLSKAKRADCKPHPGQGTPSHFLYTQEMVWFSSQWISAVYIRLIPFFKDKKTCITSMDCGVGIFASLFLIELLLIG